MIKKKEPTKQLNLRLPLPLIKMIGELAAARRMKPSAVFLEILKDAVKNRCRRCRGGMAQGGTALHPKPCIYCYGTGRRDLAKVVELNYELWLKHH
jgi:hypothetical protein